MAQYIDKDALVAEIKRKIHTEQGYSSGDTECGYRDCAREILSFIDTLEVKEVDLEKEIQMFSMDLAMKENNGDWEKDIAVTAKHFFELGLKAQEKIKL